MIQCISSNHKHFTLFGQVTKDITRLLSTDAHLGTIDIELHVHTIICDCYMNPLVGYVASVGVDGSHFVGTVSFKGKEEAWVTVPMFTNCLDAKQPATITGGIKAFVV